MEFLFVLAVAATVFFLLAAVMERLGLLEDPPPEPDPWRFDWRATRPPGALRKLGK